MRTNCSTTYTWESGDISADFEILGYCTPGYCGGYFEPPTGPEVEIVAAKRCEKKQMGNFSDVAGSLLLALIERDDALRERIEAELLEDCAARAEDAKEAAEMARAESRMEGRE